jgi:hypothetical protein
VASLNDKPTHHTYELLGESSTAFQVKRQDRGTPQVFTKATFQALLAEGRLEIIDDYTFKVKTDENWPL